MMRLDLSTSQREKKSEIWPQFLTAVPSASPSFRDGATNLRANWIPALVAPSGECLRGEGLVWLIGAVSRVHLFVSAFNGWPH